MAIFGEDLPSLGDSLQTCDCGTPMVLNRSEIREGTTVGDDGVEFAWRQPWEEWVCPSCRRTLTGPPGAPVSSR